MKRTLAAKGLLVGLAIPLLWLLRPLAILILAGIGLREGLLALLRLIERLQDPTLARRRDGG